MNALVLKERNAPGKTATATGFTRRKARTEDEKVTPDQLDGLNILIVEDILANQEVVRSLLEPAGCTVSAACNGEEALELLEEQYFDVILMDIRMPIMGGIETTEAIRASEGPHQDVPIIALTADASAEEQRTMPCGWCRCVFDQAGYCQ